MQFAKTPEGTDRYFDQETGVDYSYQANTLAKFEQADRDVTFDTLFSLSIECPNCKSWVRVKHLLKVNKCPGCGVKLFAKVTMEAINFLRKIGPQAVFEAIRDSNAMV